MRNYVPNLLLRTLSEERSDELRVRKGGEERSGAWSEATKNSERTTHLTDEERSDEEGRCVVSEHMA